MANVEVTFPLIADVKMEVAKAYGMVQPAAEQHPGRARGVLSSIPKAKIRAILYYPLSNGRNFPEIKRLLIALQTTDKHGCATPADWQPGDDVIVPPPGSCGTAKERMAVRDKGTRVVDWFLTFQELEPAKPAHTPHRPR